MRYLLLACCLFAAGCNMPETARAAKQADQAVEGIGIIVKEIYNEEDKEALRKGLDKIIKLVCSARISLQPSLQYIGDGREIRVDTTPEDAAKNTELFANRAAIQAGRAAVEVEDRLAWYSLAMSLLDNNDLMTTLSLALFGSGAVGLIIARVLKTISTYKSAIQDTIAYAKDRQEAKSSDEIELVKQKHTHRQRIRGTDKVITAELTRIKHNGPHT